MSTYGGSLLCEGHQVKSGLSNIVQTNDATGASFMGEVSARQNGWTSTGALLVAAIVGTGVLEIGGNFAQFGWYGGTALIIFFTPYNYLTSYLLNKIHLQYPTAITMGDAAQTIVGPSFGKLGYAFLYTYLFFVLGNYAVPLSTAVQQVLNGLTICKWEACIIGSVLIWPLIQLRTLSGLALLSAISFATIFSVLMITGYYMFFTDEFECAEEELPPISFSSMFNAFGGFFFAYSGQSIFLEMNAEMIEPKEFVKSLNLAYPIMVGVYYMVSASAFSQCKSYTPADYIILGIPEGPVLRVVGTLMLIHMTISYTINSQVLTRGLLVNFGVLSGLEDSLKGHAIWCAATTVILICAQTLANLIPSFGIFCSFISAFLVTPLCFMFPCTIFLYMDRGRIPEERVGMLFKTAIYAVLFTASIYWAIGTTVAVISIFQDSAGGLQCNEYKTAGGNHPGNVTLGGVQIFL